MSHGKLGRRKWTEQQEVVLLGEEFNQQGDLRLVTLTDTVPLSPGTPRDRGMLRLKAMS